MSSTACLACASLCASRARSTTFVLGPCCRSKNGSSRSRPQVWPWRSRRVACRCRSRDSLFGSRRVGGCHDSPARWAFGPPNINAPEAAPGPRSRSRRGEPKHPRRCSAPALDDDLDPLAITFNVTSLRHPCRPGLKPLRIVGRILDEQLLAVLGHAGPSALDVPAVAPNLSHRKSSRRWRVQQAAQRGARCAVDVLIVRAANAPKLRRDALKETGA